MKNFFTSMLGTIVALIIFTVGAGLLGVGLLVAVSSMSEKPSTEVEKGSYLVFDLSANVTDSPPQLDSAAFSQMFSGSDEPKTLQLRKVTKALHTAAHDDRVAGLLLTGSFSPAEYGTGFAALKEVRAALAEFKTSGKPMIAYLNYATTRDYYIASIADDVVLDPFGVIIMPGLASEPMFYAGALEKFGVGVQVTRVGKYKSYVEPFIRNDMSPESRAQTQKLLDDLWNDLVADIAVSRGLTPASVQALVDDEGMVRPEQAVKGKLVSRAAYRDEVISELKKRTGRQNSSRPFKQVSLAAYAEDATDSDASDGKKNDADKKGSDKSAGQIAIVYAEGAIVEGEGDRGEIGGEKFARELRKLRQDENVKAVVLRVNSPGGSVGASEHIQRELRLMKKAKPVVVSMGTYAASGGYWISAYGDRIFAEPTTITGSIGVFGIQFDIQKLASNLGVTFDRVKTGKFADSVTISRPKTEEELAVLQRMVDWIYGQFIDRVAEARGIDRAKVAEIAQGRVWSGAEALKLNLVDEIGGLDKAIDFTARKAGLGKHYQILEYPRKKLLAEIIHDAFENLRPYSARQGGVMTQFVDTVRAQTKVLDQFNDPKGIYARLPLEIQVK